MIKTSNPFRGRATAHLTSVIWGNTSDTWIRDRKWQIHGGWLNSIFDITIPDDFERFVRDKNITPKRSLRQRDLGL